MIITNTSGAETSSRKRYMMPSILEEGDDEGEKEVLPRGMVLLYLG